MDVLRLDLEAKPQRLGRPVVTIGNFDGLHLGHRRILGEAVARAASAGERAVVLTFDPHPVKVLHPGAGFRCLKTLDQRLADMASLGIAAVAILRFDPALSLTPPRVFAERVLGATLAASEVLVGKSFRFGHRRAGDFDLLAALGRELGFLARAVRPVVRGGAAVSSTRVREAIATGDVRAARALLGRAFSVAGTVVAGKGRGAGIGFATANLRPENECLPAPGVYGTRVRIRGRELAAATFLGEPSTFGETEPVFESHLLGWDGSETYGERLVVEFVSRLRGPVTFASVAELRRQLSADVAAVKRRVRVGRG